MKNTHKRFVFILVNMYVETCIKDDYFFLLEMSAILCVNKTSLKWLVIYFVVDLIN